MKYLLPILALLLASCAQDYEEIYTVRGVEIYCEDDGACPDPDEMRAIFDDQNDRFKPYFTADPLERLARWEAKWIVTVDPPEYQGDQVCGLTYPRVQTTIHHDCVDTDGGGGHEMRLHLVDMLFPGRDEAADIQWMRDEGIL